MKVGQYFARSTILYANIKHHCKYVVYEQIHKHPQEPRGIPRMLYKTYSVYLFFIWNYKALKNVNDYLQDKTVFNCLRYVYMFFGDNRYPKLEKMLLLCCCIASFSLKCTSSTHNLSFVETLLKMLKAFIMFIYTNLHSKNTCTFPLFGRQF